ncbi:MAG: [LysW]-aminoadipate kinase, partial [Anaerolineae bacterium]
MIVVKIGGGKGLNLAGLCEDVAALLRAGQRLVLVHGGAETTDELAAALG